MQRLYQVIAEVFDLAEKEVSIDSSMDTIANWDSLNHMILVVALEQEYDVSLDPEDIVEMVNVRIIKEILKEKGVALNNNEDK